jgi:hypothetical protein
MESICDDYEFYFMVFWFWQKLMKRAVERGCTDAFLDTFSFHKVSHSFLQVPVTEAHNAVRQPPNF